MMMKSEKINRRESREEKKRRKRLCRRRRQRSDYSKAREEDSSPSVLWDAIVSDDDICFRHVLPRLNRTDVKFLFEVNTETRALIKRAAPLELRKRFAIEEMSSISTLEFAWENRSLWPIWWDKRQFCRKVAGTNKLELLEWARGEKKCDSDERTFSEAAERGNLEMIKYCVANGCPVIELACARAARNGHLECLKYLHEDVKAPWDWETASEAALNGRLHILEYLVERKYDQYYEYACAYAAEKGHLNCLKYLHEVVKAPWGLDTAYGAALNGHLHILEYLVERKYDHFPERACTGAAGKGHLNCLKYLREVAEAPWNCEAVRMAHENNHSECLQYLLDNDCPLPEGWRYKRGELYAIKSQREWRENLFLW